MNIMNDEFYMSLALDMAERAQGQTGINPVVGCVVVKDGAVIGLGTHLQRGTGHAEVHALNMAAGKAQGSTAYVTLEPCSHYGKTPPCSQRLIDEGVARVVVACEDPNPQVAGRGFEMLREAGIDVEVGLLRSRALRLNERFIKYILTKQPFVTLKSASTLDGKLATRTGDSKWISNAQAREIVHTLRHRHQGIMVGVGTVIADNPSLTTRLEVPGLHPVRIVIDSGLRTPLDANVVTGGEAPTIIVTTTAADPAKKAALEAAGVTVITCGDGPRVDLKAAMVKLGEMEIGSILLEGGGTLNGSMLQSGLVDRVVLFYAPKIVGGGAEAPGTFDFPGVALMKEAITLEGLEVEVLGDNVCISGTPVR
ncbi:MULTISPECIES: bifunctional diaminohydroxyphosphoribosylaminopyrimidine deaminase/5-amino-6-(5-phosphoribosylamino)uracil reductase RibD [unclassified Paenibacillus]|uniref:bifunctional diaminohydroxyphosphoribosylaminopyrimidine deaminase/5-amino-6-(5-phosphoribosylamino)uracil reductase RibD n=1 Tax=unclassified Paenibacillus TaxID=185978 RepID=UPI0024052A82|nr:MULTISPECIES: bifunctional diaminohydroxyphosphoribosylaminopyrimidine deaminase/5-amino-6-(5-phosphoribosylamino)uracil reductase RibD [unclassified Paenibacillus]MDF9840383.1 diaminohydroxyphosphoribosylaminopyrimidine deaminase/5-amino-6-(5-phosphoribosylamino)uracil reductase [Paenibacillus sp. PastF-2]MDF9846965.1 diaminohydroxyphosphoribosylaminopyrimidine deaminase/5-amino-6-(5-phosphoribosylamino)uracil reductase [Paenibacillus sp. PastM-2]MDF9853537.1 diaminohydroxyphosphoribosylamin